MKKALEAIFSTFPHAKIFYIDPMGNVGLVDFQKQTGEPFDLPIGDSDTLQAISNRRTSTGKISCHIPLKAGFDTRFLAKIALALDSNLIGSEFVQSNYGQQLRSAVKEADDAKRRLIPIRGSGFFQSLADPSIAKILNKKGAWTLLLKVVNDQLGLIVATPRVNQMSILVSDAYRMEYPQYQELSEGLVWRVKPYENWTEGPLSLGKVVNDFVTEH
jgi:hypothetical protein